MEVLSPIFTKTIFIVYKLREGGVIVKLTDSSSPRVLNGAVDWLYKEELDVRSNYFWSPDSKHIAYLQTNETSVPEYPTGRLDSDTCQSRTSSPILSPVIQTRRCAWEW